MNVENKENLKEVFEKFLDGQQARQAAEDVREGEQILRQYPAPVPDKELADNIKAKISETLVRRKSTAFKYRAYTAAAVAAAFIILTTISVKLFKEEPAVGVRIPSAIWESDDIAVDDAELAVLTAEIEQIESDLIALQLADNGGNGSGAVTDLEMELVEINSDFWKG